MAAYKSAAARQNAWICFADECGSSLRPPRAHTWGLRGHTPIITVPGRGGGRVSIAGLCCYKPGQHPRLIFRMRTYHQRRGEPKGFTAPDFIRLLAAVHQQLGQQPVHVIWDNLSGHTAPATLAFIQAHSDWLTVHRLPAYAPELNPVEGIWSLIKRGPLANLAATSIDHVTTVARTALKKIQYRPALITGVLTETGLELSQPP